MSDSLEQELEKLSACIHCGMCLPTCPTYRITGSEAESPRGRLYLMKAFFQQKLDSPKQLAKHLDPCLGCLACVTACPSGVDYNSLLMTSREILVQHQPWPKRLIRRLLLKHVLPNPIILRLLRFLVYLYQKSGLQTLLRQSQFHQWGGTLGQLESFTPHVDNANFAPLEARYGKNLNGRVVLFTGCIMNALYQRIHQATITALVNNGYEVIIPPQTCCGALAHHSGEQDICQSLGQSNINQILAANPDWIVVNAAGCGSTLKEYGGILAQHPQAKAFADKVVDVLELLNQKPLQDPLFPVNKAVTYHAACHLHHAQGVQNEPYAVLNQIPGLELVPLTEADMCCGSAGVYNLAFPQNSLAILQEKMRHLKATQAEAVLAGNPGCILQLKTGIRLAKMDLAVLHPIELIAQAYTPPAAKPTPHLVESPSS